MIVRLDKWKGQLNNVSSYVQQIIIGVIIVLAVAFDTFAKAQRRH